MDPVRGLNTRLDGPIEHGLGCQVREPANLGVRLLHHGHLAWELSNQNLQLVHGAFGGISIDCQVRGCGPARSAWVARRPSGPMYSPVAGS